MNVIYRTILFFCLSFFFASLSVSQPVQEKVISGKFENVPLKEFLNQIGKDNGIHFYFRDEWISNFVVSQSFENQPLIQLLNSLFKSQSLSYHFFQDNAVLIFPKTADLRSNDSDSPQLLIIGDLLNEGRFKQARLSGKIVDGKDGEPLAGAIIWYSKTANGSISDQEGHFELNMPTGDYTLHINIMGYETLNQKLKLIEDGHASFELFQETHDLEEVVVLGEESKASKAQMSMVKISARSLRELPVMMGEPDVLKSIIMMPGIQSVGEMASGFNVRGGNTDQNLVLLNGAPVFNTSHLFGFFSMINPDAVKDVTLFKGGMPASYGERVASIMEVQMKDGNTETLRLYGGLGIINSRATLEGPLKKESKNTFLLGARSTYSDWILRQTRDKQFLNSVANFYDINGNVNFLLGENNHLKLMGYMSSDKFNLNSTSLYNYENQLASINWKMNITQELVSDLNLAYSNYRFQLEETDVDWSADDYILKTGVQYSSIKYKLSWLPNEKHLVATGFQGMGYFINPGEISPGSSITNIEKSKVQKERSVELGAFIEDDFDVNPNLAMTVGIRYAYFTNLGPSTVFLYEAGKTRSDLTVTDSITFSSGEKINSFQGFEPRFALKFTIDPESSLRFSLQRVHQFVNQLSNTSVATPADFWKSSDYYVKPLISDQIALGYFRDLKRGIFETSAEIYFKNMQNLTEYKNGAKLVMNEHPETDIIQADGYAYGLELYAKKTSGRLNGWLSYTYSKTMRKTVSDYSEEIINGGKYYPSAYDKPHELSAVMNYKISRRWRFSGNFVLSSGRPVTLPELKYSYNDKQIVYYSDRNKYRMPTYHRLDVSITLDENLRKRRMWKGSWTFSIYNLYGRKNPYSVFYRKDPSIQISNKENYALYKLSIIGIPVPTITYNFTF